MICKKSAFLGLLALSCSISAFSQESPSIQLPDQPHRLYIGPTAAWYNNAYTTDQDQSGPSYGGIIGYDYLKNDTIYAGAHFNYLAGKLLGAFGNGFTQEFWTEGRIGYRMSMGDENQFSLAPFTGYGYLVFLQEINQPTDFRYRFMYIPLGFRGTWQACDFLEMGLNAMGGIPFASRWSVADKHSGNTRITAYIELPFRFFLTTNKLFDLSIVPYWRNWSTRNQETLVGQVNNIVGARIELGFNL